MENMAAKKTRSLRGWRSRGRIAHLYRAGGPASGNQSLGMGYRESHTGRSR